MPSGGGNFQDRRPQDPSGRLYRDRLGTHRGQAEYMNVRNPQPSVVYAYARRERGRLIEVTRRGYKVVGPEDPEYAGQTNDPNLKQAGLLDTSYQGIDTILVKIPEERLRERQLEKARRAREALTGATDEWLRSTPSADRERYESEDRPIRYKDPRHGLQFK